MSSYGLRHCTDSSDRILADLKMYTDLYTQFFSRDDYKIIIIFKTIFIRKLFPHLSKISKIFLQNYQNYPIYIYI